MNIDRANQDTYNICGSSNFARFNRALLGIAKICHRALYLPGLYSQL